MLTLTYQEPVIRIVDVREQNMAHVVQIPVRIRVHAEYTRLHQIPEYVDAVSFSELNTVACGLLENDEYSNYKNTPRDRIRRSRLEYADVHVRR